MTKTGILMVISGPSGAGKGTIASQLSSRKDIHLSVSATTREKRAKEVEGVNYHYLSQKSFIEKIEEGAFLEYAQVYDNYYGTLREKVVHQMEQGKDVILEIDMQGALKVKKNHPEAVCVFILPPSMEELKDRIVCRARESMEEIEKRLSKISEEMAYIDHYDYVVVNDQVEKAVSKIEAILIAEKCRPSLACACSDLLEEVR